MRQHGAVGFERNWWQQMLAKSWPSVSTCLFRFRLLCLCCNLCEMRRRYVLHRLFDLIVFQLRKVLAGTFSAVQYLVHTCSKFVSATTKFIRLVANLCWTRGNMRTFICYEGFTPTSQEVLVQCQYRWLGSGNACPVLD